ncbi:hypothetical protein LOJ90_003007, partial [Enterococcus faecalis]|nr:hypothetical protein [Enterococcus faecalis]
MSESVGIILGAVIALFGTIVTNYFTMKKTRLQEEKNSDRFLKKLKAEEEIELKTFEHNIVMNNREHIPNAARDIVVEINQLFDSTEELVFNYPGTGYTGERPSILFSSTIDHLITGFPNSMEDIKELSNTWYHSNKKFKNVIFENSMFFPTELMNEIWEYEKYCSDIKDYFYGRYSSIKSEEEFSAKKNEYQEQVDKYVFIQKDGIAS